MKRAVYAGSFDILTNGHLYVINEALCLFDQLYISIGVNPFKKTTFSLDERIGFIKAVVNDMNPYFLPLSRVIVSSFENKYLVKYAREIDALHMVRGIRSPADFEYERTMMNVNGEIEGHARKTKTVFIIPPRELVDVSSSFVKALVGPEGWQENVKRYVPKAIVGDFIAHYEGAK
jgi:pantetheine-phosphate adenylyltransferase